MPERVGVGEQLQLWKWSCLEGRLWPMGSRQESTYSRLCQEHQADHANSIVPACLSPILRQIPPPVLMAYIHICSLMFGVECENSSIKIRCTCSDTSTSIQPNPRVETGLIYSSLYSITAFWLLCSAARRSLVKPCDGSWPLDLATCFMDCLAGVFLYVLQEPSAQTHQVFTEDWRPCLLVWIASLAWHWLHRRNNSTSPASLVNRGRKKRDKRVIGNYLRVAH